MSEDPQAPDHHRQPSGSEPMTARSPLRLRALLSGSALVAGVVAAVLFLMAAEEPGNRVAAGICAVIALIALIDLAVIARRART